MISGWRGKPVVKVRLHPVPSKRGTHSFMFSFGCATHSLWILFCLPSIQGVQWPDISGTRPVSGDDSSFSCFHPTDNVIHSSDDGDFGKAHDCILKVFCFLQCLHSLHSISQSFISSNKNILILLTSLSYSPP